MDNTEKVVYIRPASRSAEKEVIRAVMDPVTLDTDDQKLNSIFAKRGLRFETANAVIVRSEEYSCEDAKAIYNSKARMAAAKALLGPGTAAAILFMGVSFGWITTGFFRFLVAGCITWAAAAIWG